MTPPFGIITGSRWSPTSARTPVLQSAESRFGALADGFALPTRAGKVSFNLLPQSITAANNNSRTCVAESNSAGGRRTAGHQMRLADFIVSNIEPILMEWEVFARGTAPGAKMDALALRDHAPEILLATVQDMKSSQSATERSA